MPRRRPAHRAEPVRRGTGPGLRAARGALAATVVVLTASGAASVVPQAAAPTPEEITAQAVASVWRSAGTDAVQSAADAPATLLAEVAGERDAGGTSRSQDRTAEPVAPGEGDDAAPVTPADGGATSPVAASGAATTDGATATTTATATATASTTSADDGATTSDPSAGDGAAAPAADAVARAAQQVQALVVQQDADAADVVQAAGAGAASAAAARAAVEQAQAQRDAEEAAAALAAAQADPRPLARPMVAERGWDGSQFQCLDRLWTKESGWRWSADNPTSSAYGIPQSLPGQKMAAAGSDWETNPVTQITWGLGYIADVYGTPCRAWAHSQATDWY